MKLKYDSIGDVLYVTFEQREPGTYIYVENDNGDVIKMDRQTRRIVGCTIMFFMARLKNGSVEMPEIGGVQFSTLADELLHV